MSLRNADRRSSNARQPDNSEQCRFQQPLKTIQGKKKRQRREKQIFQAAVCFLQGTAYAVKKWYPERDSNPYSRKKQILSLLCLPFHHPGTNI